MNIKSPAEDRIIVELTQQDMLELEITYEDMDYSTIETRRVIWTVLDEAGKALGRELDPSRRMIIEATPGNEGGCILNFTILETEKKYLLKKQLLRKHPQNIVCEFDGIDSLYKAAESLNKNGFTDSGLYENEGRYRLIVRSGSKPALLRCLLNEFGCAENTCALACDFTKEHWRELIAENAISKMLN